VRYDAAEDPSGAYAALTAGAPVMALSQKCVHLGCRVPWCASAAWFECPCHNSKYNRWGEWQDGPAPRGMDRHALEVADGRVLVDVATLVTGPGRGGGVLIQPPEGAHCTARG
jgi:cytochrome b6-f complex iron-sulfur subunit